MDKRSSTTLRPAKKGPRVSLSTRLPDVSKPFLFFHEKQGIPLGILAQELGPCCRAVTSLPQMLLTTFTAIKIKEQNAWIHHSQVKKLLRDFRKLYQLFYKLK